MERERERVIKRILRRQCPGGERKPTSNQHRLEDDTMQNVTLVTEAEMCLRLTYPTM